MTDQSTIKADRSDTIARHNDAFRKALKTTLTPDGLVRGRVVVTRSVHDLPEQLYLAAVEKCGSSAHSTPETILTESMTLGHLA